MAKTLGARKLRKTRDIETSVIERKRMVGIRAKEILRQSSSLMTHAEAVAIAKSQMAGEGKRGAKAKVFDYTPGVTPINF
jgi:hypothetical protein|tara:strand:+ start:107 stop:346 length:240 start_codon:yes stop_codon:yes gene_type:complete